MAARPLIAHVIYRFAMGGMENGLVNLLNGMDKRFDHAIVCLNGHTSFRERLSRQDVTLHDIAKKPGKDLPHYARLWRTLRRLRPAVVHTRNIGTIEAGVVARAAGVGAVLHGEHGFDMVDLHGANKRYRQLRRACSPFINRFVCVSQQISQWLRETVGIRQDKLVQIYNGVDSDKFHPDRDAGRRRLAELGVSGGFTVGVVGRLESVKNPAAAVTAFAMRCEADEAFRREAQLVIVGGGSLEDSLRKKAIELGLADRVLLLGARDDVAELMPGFDLFLLPSLNEGISNTILEAMACGLPVLAGNVGGNPELVTEGETGMLYPAEDMQRLAECLGLYFSNPDVRQAQARNAREQALQRFSMESMITRYEGVYSEYC